MNVLELLSQTLADLLRQDTRRVLLGEDVSTGGMLGLSRAAASHPQLAERLLPTPLTPSALPAHAGGLALSGCRPIVLMPSTQALLDGLSALREVAVLPWRTGGELTTPVVFIAPVGPGFGLGGDASEAHEALLCRVPNLRVLSIGDGHEAGALLRAAAEFWAGEEPTVLLVPRTLALQLLDPDRVVEQLARPFAHPHRLHEGEAATVFAWGSTVEVARAAVERSGMDVAVVDVECLSPLPHDALVEEAAATGRIVIAHAGPRDHGVGAELAALFADRAILHLDAPITRVTGLQAPLRAVDEMSAVPGVDRLGQAIAEIVNY